MAVEIVELRTRHGGPRDGQAVMVCNTSETAFGPVLESVEAGRAFVKWLLLDPRRYDANELTNRYHEWRVEREETVA